MRHNQREAQAAGIRLGVPWYLDAEEMLAELKPDLCSVATGGYEYASDHYKPTMQALAGCHVLCEKPISNEIAPAREMVALQRKRVYVLPLILTIALRRRQSLRKVAGRRPDWRTVVCEHGSLDRQVSGIGFTIFSSEGA